MMYVLLSIAITTLGNDVYDRVEHGYADSDGVKTHYASLGKGPLVVMIHGFPDFWYTWRDQMDALSSDFQVVAIDTRGYNKSDKPEGVAS
jgi:pimeloyl-ACP methyl ester carboxylesterase